MLLSAMAAYIGVGAQPADCGNLTDGLIDREEVRNRGDKGRTVTS